MTNLVVILVLAVILGGAIAYIYKKKKSGAKCIGCPDSGACGSACKGQCAGSCGGCQECPFGGE